MADAIEQWLSEYPVQAQTVFERLRALVKSAMPDAKERFYQKQDHTSYSLTGLPRDEVIYLVPMQDYVRLGFFWGGDLPDPHHLLQGEGKRLRHIKISSPQDISPAVADLIGAVWTHPRAHSQSPSGR